MRRRVIADILESWPYDPDGISFRLIPGEDGREKLQIRLDLGILQLELDGRPDGLRPFGYDSVLDWHEGRVEELRGTTGAAAYSLPPTDCEALRAEAVQVYQRYFRLFQIGRFDQVIADTSRNLRCLDFVFEHAELETDRWSLESYRPYIVMVNSLARCERDLAADDSESAARVLRLGLATIRRFVAEHEERFGAAQELEVLAERLKEIERLVPRDEVERLQQRLAGAVAREDYETAAQLRDQLDRVLPPPPGA